MQIFSITPPPRRTVVECTKTENMQRPKMSHVLVFVSVHVCVMLLGDGTEDVNA